MAFHSAPIALASCGREGRNHVRGRGGGWGAGRGEGRRTHLAEGQVGLLRLEGGAALLGELHESRKLLLAARRLLRNASRLALGRHVCESCGTAGRHGGREVYGEVFKELVSRRGPRHALVSPPLPSSALGLEPRAEPRARAAAAVRAPVAAARVRSRAAAAWAEVGRVAIGRRVGCYVALLPDRREGGRSGAGSRGARAGNEAAGASRGSSMALVAPANGRWQALRGRRGRVPLGPASEEHRTVRVVREGRVSRARGIAALRRASRGRGTVR